MVHEKRKERKQNKNITKGFSTIRILCVFRGQIICLISVFIYVHLWTYIIVLLGCLYSAHRKKGAEAPIIQTVIVPTTSVDSIAAAARGNGARGDHVNQSHHQNPYDRSLQASAVVAEALAYFSYGIRAY